MEPPSAASPPPPPAAEEHFDVLDASGALTGVTCPRSEVHACGFYHRAVHVWLVSPATREVLLQRRAAHKDSWPGLWDISSAGHISAGQASLAAAQRELEEELGLRVPAARLRLAFSHLERKASVQGGRAFIDNEWQDVYVLRVAPGERGALDPANATLRDLPPSGLPPPSGEEAAGPLAAFALQRSEVSAVRWVALEELERLYRERDPSIVPWDTGADLERLLAELRAV
jgi:isopentenyldiphosphate isomerase